MMARYYEERVSDGRHDVVVCVPHNLYSEFLAAIIAENASRKLGAWLVTSLRPNVGRITKGAISYDDFRGAFF